MQFRSMKDVFAKYDEDKDGHLSLTNFKKMLEDIDKKTRALPATAQVAAQEGKYLGMKLNQLRREKNAHEENLPPFKYRHLGSLVYLGDESAAIDFGNSWTLQGYG